MHLKEQNETLRNNNESYLKQLNDLKKLNETLHNNLKQIDTKHLETYNKDLNKAIDSMKKKNDINIKSEVNSMELLYKAKIEFLTEQNNDLTLKVKTLNDTITSKSKAYDTLSLETSKQINSLNEQISYLTLQLQIRNEQCNSLTTFNDSNTQIIKQMNNENEALHEKLKVLKEELLTQAENHMQKQTKTKALLSLSETQNKNYEQIESELDKIICNTTLISTNDESSIKFIKALNEIPTNNKRRISQCLLLAQRIQELSTNITKLNTEIKTLQTELTKTNQERDMYMSLADKVQQPYEKLLLDLKQQNDQIALLNNINIDNENKFKYIMERNTELENKNKELENDLKTVLGNRRKIDDLEYIVKSYLEEQQQLQELTKGKYGRSTFGVSSKQKQK
jgi:chromosome segregation ATPase